MDGWLKLCIRIRVRGSGPWPATPLSDPVGHYNLLDLAFHCPNFTTLSILPYGWVCLDADPHVASFGLTTGKRTISYAEGLISSRPISTTSKTIRRTFLAHKQMNDFDFEIV